MGRTADRRPDRADEPMPPSGEAADALADGSGPERQDGRAPDLRDPTNGSPYLTG